MRRQGLAAIFFLCALLAPASAAFATSAPENINKVDAKGRKQGPWSKTNPVSGMRYEGVFKDDMPQGKFLYWNKGDTLVSEAFYFRGGYASFTRFFYPDGGVMAEGYYLEKQKDSLWKYFSADGRLLKEESFERGLLNGALKIYDSAGQILQRQTWFRGLRHGDWFEHDENGYQSYAYKLNLTHGPYHVRYPDSTRHIEGFYEDGRKQGLWRFYLPDGTLYKEDTYQDNEVKKRTLYLKIEGDLRAVDIDTVALVLRAPKNGQAEISTLSGARWLCDGKYETVCGIFDIERFFYANKNTMVAYAVVDNALLREVMPEKAESELYDGQADEAALEGGNASVRPLRIPLTVKTAFPVFLDADGMEVLRHALDDRNVEAE